MGTTNKYKGPLEPKIGAQLEKIGASFEYEAEKLKWIAPAKEHTYTPDFKILKNDGTYMYIEGKGGGPIYGLTLDERKKHLLVRERYPEKDIRFIFMNPFVKIYKGSKTSYAEWCSQNNFKYSCKAIPTEWIKEIKIEGVDRNE